MENVLLGDGMTLNRTDLLIELEHKSFEKLLNSVFCWSSKSSKALKLPTTKSKTLAGNMTVITMAVESKSVI